MFDMNHFKYCDQFKGRRFGEDYLTCCDISNLSVNWIFFKTVTSSLNDTSEVHFLTLIFSAKYSIMNKKS